MFVGGGGVRVGMLKANYTGYGAACRAVRGMVDRGGLRSIGFAGMRSVIRVLGSNVVTAPTIIISKTIGIGKRIPSRGRMGRVLNVWNAIVSAGGRLGVLF